MSCDCQTPKNCCQDCPDIPDPVLPLCDIALPDGTFTNTTVVVEDGCIVSVTDGRHPQYSPVACCPDGGGGGGGGGTGPVGPQGPAGPGATLTIGTVTTLAPGASATVVNVGTPTNAVWDIGIPRGADGAGGSGGSVGFSGNECGWDIQDGVIKAVPVNWRPITNLVIEVAGISGIVANFQLGTPVNGCVDKLTLNTTQLASIIESIQSALTDLNTRVAECCGSGTGPAPNLDPKTVTGKLGGGRSVFMSYNSTLGIAYISQPSGLGGYLGIDFYDSNDNKIFENMQPGSYTMTPQAYSAIQYLNIIPEPSG